MLASKLAACFMFYCLEEECGNVPVYLMSAQFISDENWLGLWLNATLVPQLFLLKTFFPVLGTACCRGGLLCHLLKQLRVVSFCVFLKL